MSRELMPKSGIMMPHVVVTRDAAVVGVSTVDGVAGAVDLTGKYLQKTDAAATYQTKTEGASKTYVLDSIQPIMEGALFKADPFVDNNIPFRSAGANGVESVDMIKVTPENSIKLGSYESSVQGVEIHSAGRVVVVDKNDSGVETKYPVYSKRFRPEIEDLPFAAIGSYVKDSKGRTIGVNRTGINSDIKQFTQKVTFQQPVSVADAVDATNAINLGQISSLSENTGVNLVGGASHTGTSTDAFSFSTLTIRDDVYIRDNTVSIPTDGISTDSGNLYLTRNSVSYKLVTSTGDFTWPSEYLTSVPDLKASIEAVCTFGRNIDLAGSTVNLSSATLTKNVSNGTLKALSDIGSFIFVNGCRLYNVKVDCNNKAVRRAVHIPTNSVNSVVDFVEIFNSTGATNANGLFVDANNARGFIVNDVYIHNITSVGNGSQGDATGPCRGIIVGTALDPEPTSTTVSSGSINNIIVRDLAPFEDCDGVVVQIYDSSANMLSAKNIVISNIHTSNVRKRAVKIQANDVTVRGVEAYCDTTDTAMYSIVSLYGTNGVAENISGRGRISNGIDCAYGFNHVRGLYLNTERTGDDTLSGIGAGLLINSGQVDAVDVYSEGAEYVVAVRDALGDTPYVKIDGIRGKGYSGVIRFQIRAGHSIGEVYLSNISATTSATNKGAVSLDFTSNQISYLNVSGVKHIASASTLPDFNLSGQVTEARFDDCVFRGGTSSIGINMVTGKLVASNISSTKIFAVAANQTTDAYIASVDGAVRLTDTTNSHLVLTRSPTLVGTNTGIVQTSYA